MSSRILHPPRSACGEVNDFFFQRPEQNETSLAIVPRNHAILSLPNLEAEASGLLDRLLSVFQEDSRYLMAAPIQCQPNVSLTVSK